MFLLVNHGVTPLIQAGDRVIVTSSLVGATTMPAAVVKSGKPSGRDVYLYWDTQDGLVPLIQPGDIVHWVRKNLFGNVTAYTGTISFKSTPCDSGGNEHIGPCKIAVTSGRPYYTCDGCLDPRFVIHGSTIALELHEAALFNALSFDAFSVYYSSVSPDLKRNLQDLNNRLKNDMKELETDDSEVSGGQIPKPPLPQPRSKIQSDSTGRNGLSEANYETINIDCNNSGTLSSFLLPPGQGTFMGVMWFNDSNLGHRWKVKDIMLDAGIQCDQREYSEHNDDVAGPCIIANAPNNIAFTVNLSPHAECTAGGTTWKCAPTPQGTACMQSH